MIFGVLKTGGVSIDRALASEEATHHPMPETGWSRPAETRLWVPVSAYLLTHPEGTVLSTLVGSVRSEQTPRATLWRVLSSLHEARVPPEEAIDEHLTARGLAPAEFVAVARTPSII